jgi:hypothetical protein
VRGSGELANSTPPLRRTLMVEAAIRSMGQPKSHEMPKIDFTYVLFGKVPEDCGETVVNVWRFGQIGGLYSVFDERGIFHRRCTLSFSLQFCEVEIPLFLR